MSKVNAPSLPAKLPSSTTETWSSAAAGSNKKIVAGKRQKSWAQLRAEWFFAATLLCLLRYLPLWGANLVAGSCVGLLDRLVPKLRQTARANLSFAFADTDPGHREQIVDGVFRSLARLLVAVGKMPSLNRTNIEKWIGYEGLENYQAAKQAGHGILVATAHLGNWELSAFAHALLTEPMNVMIRPLDNPYIDRMVERLRTATGNTLIAKKDAARSVLRALRRNEAVGMLIDQNTMPDEGVFVRFFGEWACANSGFMKLAYHSEAAVIPGFAFWSETTKRYTIRFYERVPLTGNLQTDTQRIHTIYEGLIRKHPDQWMWIHRRWKTRPNGEPPLY